MTIVKFGKYAPLDTGNTWLWRQKVKGHQKVTRGHLVKIR